MELTDAQVQKVIDIDLIGTWRTDKYAALTMRKQGFGRIINISSTSGMYGTPSWPPTAWPSGACAA